MKVITSENAHKHAQMQYLKPPIRDLQLSQESATHRKHKAFRPFGVTPWNLSYMSFSMLKMIALKSCLDEALGKAISPPSLLSPFLETCTWVVFWALMGHSWALFGFFLLGYWRKNCVIESELYYMENFYSVFFRCVGSAVKNSEMTELNVNFTQIWLKRHCN